MSVLSLSKNESGADNPALWFCLGLFGEE